MVHPDDIVIDEWDINSSNLGESMEKAQVLEPALQDQLKSHMQGMKPRPSIYFPEFIAANQVKFLEILFLVFFDPSNEVYFDFEFYASVALRMRYIMT